MQKASSQASQVSIILHPLQEGTKIDLDAIIAETLGHNPRNEQMGHTSESLVSIFQTMIDTLRLRRLLAVVAVQQHDRAKFVYMLVP